MRRLTISILSLVVLGILFVVLFTFVRRPYESVLLNRFGQLIGQQDQTRLAYNWYFKLPTDKVIRIDTRIHLFPNTLQQVVTAGSESIAVRAYAAWRIKDPVKFYQTTSASDVMAQQILSQKISGAVQAKIAGENMDDLFNVDPSKVKTSEMEQQIAQIVNAGIQEQGLEVTQIGFSRMAFPPSNANQVYDRMAAEQNRKAQQFVANGISKSTSIRAYGERDAQITRSEATKQAEEIRGKGDAAALEALAEVQQSPSAREFYQYWKSLDFVKNSLTKNTYLVLPTDSVWLKALFVAPQESGATTRPAMTKRTPAAPAPAPMSPKSGEASLGLVPVH